MISSDEGVGVPELAAIAETIDTWMRSLRRCEMTNGEQKMLWRGVVAGTLMGLVIGGMIALFIAVQSEFLAALIR